MHCYHLHLLAARWLTFPFVGSARVLSTSMPASLYRLPHTAGVAALAPLLPPLPLLLLLAALFGLLLAAAAAAAAAACSLLMETGSAGLLASKAALNSLQCSHRPPAFTCE
jgi:hypothetical protein